ncbi:MAG: metallopeptidase family protein [Dehalococcoidales bacterium]|jgi:predicted Zn-dependent protease with MMP-like domain|nr:metallopeptidase family protein [Dehalococcoidales bacterium]
MDRSKFEELVARAVEGLPAEFRERLDNVDVVVEDLPSREQLQKAGVGKGYTLLGLYEGIPLTRRDAGYNLVVPDRITVFQRTIEAKCGRKESAIEQEIRRVIQHEIAHHFGIGDARLQTFEKRSG